MSEPTTVTGVIERLREIDAALAPDDGAAVFNRMYLTVTERIAARLADPTDGLFADDALHRRPRRTLRRPLAPRVRRCSRRSSHPDRLGSVVRGAARQPVDLPVRRSPG